MYEYRASLVKIVDGDTIDVDLDLGFAVVLKKQRIRLYGINTPESRTRDKEEKYRGLQAKARFKDLIKDRPTRLLSHGKGKYGRVLGEILFESKKVEDKWINVNKQLVKEGHAVEYYGGKR